MDESCKKRAGELVNELKRAGVNCGLLVIQEAVVLRSPGAPYTDSLLDMFSKNDVLNATQLGLLTKMRMTGSADWEWYVAISA